MAQACDKYTKTSLMGMYKLKINLCLIIYYIVMIR